MLELLVSCPKTDINLQTPLISAIELADLEIIDLILQKTDLNINSKNKKEYTPLMLAAEKGNMQVVKKLLVFQDMELETINTAGKTAFDLASEKDHIDTARLIQSAIADRKELGQKPRKRRRLTTI